MDIGYVTIIGLFLVYYLAVLIISRKMISEPKEILSKFFAVMLFFAGVSIIYFSFTGRAFLGGTTDNYNLYIFIMGFVAILWTIPELLKEFKFFENFINRGKEVMQTKPQRQMPKTAKTRASRV
jgi:hypothetical protein